MCGHTPRRPLVWPAPLSFAFSCPFYVLPPKFVMAVLTLVVHCSCCMQEDVQHPEVLASTSTAAAPSSKKKVAATLKPPQPAGATPKVPPHTAFGSTVSLKWLHGRLCARLSEYMLLLTVCCLVSRYPGTMEPDFHALRRSAAHCRSRQRCRPDLMPGERPGLGWPRGPPA